MTTLDCDVLVAGGGCAGIAAARGAAGEGARVILVERHGFLGGIATASGVGTLCGLYLRDPSGPRYAANGFASKWAERLARSCASTPVAVGRGLYVLPYDVPRLKRLADATIAEAPLVEPLLHATLIGTGAEAGRVSEVQALTGGSLVAIRPQALVDATGDATLVRLAGGPAEDLAETQAASVVLTLDRPVPQLVEPGPRLAVVRAILRATESGLLPRDCATASFVPADFVRDRPRLKLVLSEPPTPRRSWPTRLELSARATLESLAEFLPTLAPLGDARVADESVQVGVRATWRASGKYTLTREDVLACRKFADGVARGAWPIERWEGGPSPRLEVTPEGDFYEVPLGSLQVEGLQNVLVAGRCISADPDALASARVIGTALDTGFAAGVVAASLARGQETQGAVERVRERLADETHAQAP